MLLTRDAVTGIVPLGATGDASVIGFEFPAVATELLPSGANVDVDVRDKEFNDEPERLDATDKEGAVTVTERNVASGAADPGTPALIGTAASLALPGPWA